MEDPNDWIVAIAREHPSALGNRHQVVVLEGDGRITVNDFDAFERALAYADDVASESDVPWPLAYVLDPDFKVVHRGRHYASRYLDRSET